MQKTQEGIVEKAELIGRVSALVESAGRGSGIEAVEVQWLGAGAARLLRIFIDKPQGVSLEDCEMISRHVGTALDEGDFIPGGHYQLEVSSPGVERKLRGPADFIRFTGQKVKLALREPLPGDTRRHWEGTLAGLAQGILTLQPAKGESVRIPLAQIDKANLKFEW